MYAGDLAWLRGGRTMDVVSPYEDSTELQDQLRAPPPTPRQQETGKYGAALSRFDLVPIETGGCSCLVLVPAVP